MAIGSYVRSACKLACEQLAGKLCVRCRGSCARFGAMRDRRGRWRGLEHCAKKASRLSGVAALSFPLQARIEAFLAHAPRGAPPQFVLAGRFDTF